MKIKNDTRNTLYVEEIDLHLPYQDGEAQTIDSEILKKSKSLRGYIINGLLDVLEYDPNERIEASIMYLRGKAAAAKVVENTESDKIEMTDLITSADDIEVRIHGIFLDGGGYAKVNRNLALKLDEAGLKVKVDAKRSQNQLRESELMDIKRLSKTQLSKNHIAIDSIIPTFAEPVGGKYRILYTTIESYTIPKQFLECCQLYAEIWVTSPWSASILKKYIKKPIYVVPAGVDQELYTEKGPKFDFKPNIKDFVFISVFGWSYRKGYDVLLKAYFEEFDASDNVSLLIASRYQTGATRSHRNRIRDDINTIMRDYPNKDMPHVVRYSQVTPEQQMPQLYRSAHCFVLPSRGEGSNLCAPEASLCGLPIIMTNVSGQCVPPETIIETSNGAKTIKDIAVGEQIISHTGKFRKIVHKFTRQYSNNLLRIKSYGNDDLLITPDHPILMKRNIDDDPIFIPAKNINKGDFLLCPKQQENNTHEISLSDFINENEEQVEKIDGWWKLKRENRRKGSKSVPEVGKDIGIPAWQIHCYLNDKKIKLVNKCKIEKYIESFGEINKPPIRIPDKIKLDYDFGFLGGFYLSESSNQDVITSFHLNLHETHYAEQIKNIIKTKFNLDCVIIKNKDRTTLDIKVYSTLFRVVFESLYGKLCYNKSPGILSLINCPDFQKGLLVGQLQGDGHRRERYWEVTTTSPHIAIGIRRSFWHFDIPTAIRSRVRKGKLRSYEIRIGSKYVDILNKWANSDKVSRKYSFPFIKIKKELMCFPVCDIKRELYSGKLYNLETEIDNSYIANGAIVHNCMYLRPDNAFLIEMDHLAAVQTGLFHLHYWDGQKFPALTSATVRNQLRKAMRYVVEHPAEARTRNKKLQKLIKEQFTWNNTVNAAIERLRQINKEIKN